MGAWLRRICQRYQRLKAKRKPAAAATALAALETASNESWAQWASTRSRQYIFNFSGDPALVVAVRAAWPNADDDARWMLDTAADAGTSTDEAMGP